LIDAILVARREGRPGRRFGLGGRLPRC